MYVKQRIREYKKNSWCCNHKCIYQHYSESCRPSWVHVHTFANIFKITLKRPMHMYLYFEVDISVLLHEPIRNSLKQESQLSIGSYKRSWPLTFPCLIFTVLFNNTFRNICIFVWLLPLIQQETKNTALILRYVSMSEITRTPLSFWYLCILCFLRIHFGQMVYTFPSSFGGE